MDAPIITAASTGLALAMLIAPQVFVAVAMFAAILLLIGTTAVLLAYLVGVPAAALRELGGGSAEKSRQRR